MAIGAPITGAVKTNTAGATTIAIAYPVGLTSSHIMVLAVSVNNATRATLPGGWTSVADLSATGNTLSPGLIVGIKQATGSESGNLTVTTPNVKSAGQIIAFDGVNLTTPQDVAATTVDKAAGSANMVLSSLTTTRGGCAVVYVGTMSTGADLATPPGSFTETGDGIGTGGWPLTTGYQLAVVGATGTKTITWDNTDKGVGCMLALRNADQPIGTGLNTTTATRSATADLTRGADATLAVTATETATATATRNASATVTTTAALAADATLTRGAAAPLAVTAGLAADALLTRIIATGLFGIVTARTADVTLTRNADGTLTVTVPTAFAAGATLTRGADAAETTTAALAATGLLTRGAVAAGPVTVTLDADATVISGGTIKVWDGAAWVNTPLKVWDGAAWVSRSIKTWDGAAWVSH